MIHYEGVSSAAALLHISAQGLHRRIKNASFPCADIALGDFRADSPINSAHSLQDWFAGFRSLQGQIQDDPFLGWSRTKVIDFGVMAGLLQPDGTPNPDRKTGGYVTKENFLRFPQYPTYQAVYLSVKAIQRLTPLSWATVKTRLGPPAVLIGNHYGGWHPRHVVDTLIGERQ